MLVAVVVRVVVRDIVAVSNEARVLPLIAQRAAFAPLASADFKIDGPAIVEVERCADAAVADGGFADVRAAPTCALETERLLCGQSSVGFHTRPPPVPVVALNPLILCRAKGLADFVAVVVNAVERVPD